MGGIAGVIHFKGDRPEPTVVRAMCQQLSSGPHHQVELIQQGPIVLGCPTSAVSPSDAIQDDELFIVFDGNLYDRHTCDAKLDHSHPIRTDTECFRLAWRAWGTGLTQHLEGSYAAAVWDGKRQTLHLLRDASGTRPLYWTRTNNRFAFASELPALLQVPWIGTALDQKSIAEYLSFRVVHSPRTLLSDVRSLPPAHWLRVHADQLEVRQYWSLTYAAPVTSRPKDGDVVPQLQEAMTRAVQRRLIPGKSSALYLSGGLGSTAIAAAARTLNITLPSYTISFADDPHPESPFAGRVARLLGLEHHSVVVGTAQVASAFDNVVQTLGHPVGNPATILQYLLAKAVGESVDLAFSGDGSVELFGGRMLDPIARDIRRARAVSQLPPIARSGTKRTIDWVGTSKRWTTDLSNYGLNLELGGSNLFNADDRAALLLDPDLVQPDIRSHVLAPFYDEVDTDPLNQVLNAYRRSWLEEGVLVRAHRTANAAGLSMCLPLLDREILTMAAALPGSFKVRRVRGSLRTRWPLRAMLKGVLPPPLVNRPKRWMPAPLDNWLGGPGRLFLESRVQRLKDNRHGLWNPVAIERLRQNVNRKPGTGLRLWVLFILEAWLDGLTDRQLAR